jgi:biotin carboxyl carrier protein
MRDGLALQYAAANLRSDEEIVKSAVSQKGFALCYASAALRSNRDVVLCSKGGYALQFASPECQADRDIVHAACSQDGWALQFASPELRRDRSLVRVAALNDWRAMQWADETLRADRNFILDISASNWRALEFASLELRTDPDMIEMAQGCQAFEVFKLDLLEERKAALAQASPSVAIPTPETEALEAALAAAPEGEVRLQSPAVAIEVKVLQSPIRNGKNSTAFSLVTVPKALSNGEFQLVIESMKYEGGPDGEDLDKSWYSAEHNPVAEKKAVRFSEPTPDASSFSSDSKEGYSSGTGSSHCVSPPPKDMDTPQSVLSTPRETTPSPKTAMAIISAAVTVEIMDKNCRSSPVSMPAIRHANEEDETGLVAVLEAHGRADLLIPLKKAGIRSPAKLARAGDALLLGPSVGLKLEEVVSFRRALSESRGSFNFVAVSPPDHD